MICKMPSRTLETIPIFDAGGAKIGKTTKAADVEVDEIEICPGMIFLKVGMNGYQMEGQEAGKCLRYYV